MYEGVLFGQLPVKRHAVGIVVPFTVKPYSSYFTIVGEQFGELAVHESVVGVPVAQSGVSAGV